MEADCFMTDTIHLPFNLKKMKKAFANWHKTLDGKGWPALYLENHDHPRIVDRYGDLNYRIESAKMLATMCYMQSGTVFIYQGQEIGMTNFHLDSLDQFKDVVTFNNQKIFKKLGFSDNFYLKVANKTSRENSRTPVQWTSGEYAGFSTTEPWFHLNPNYKQINVEQAENDENSILNYYRKLLKFRKENPIVIYGDYKEHYKESDKLYVYERNYEGKRLLVISSFSDKPVTFNAPEGFNLKNGKKVLGNYTTEKLTDNGFIMNPYETRVYLFE